MRATPKRDGRLMWLIDVCAEDSVEVLSSKYHPINK